VADDNLFNLVAENVLESLGETFKFLLYGLIGLLLFVALLKLKVLGDINELLAI